MLYHGNAMDYIYETPDILQYILENKKEILEDSNRVLKDKKISEIYLTGSGSSYNAAVAVADFAKKLLGDDGVPVEYHVTFWKSELIDFVILQQDAFDEVDAVTPMERQEEIEYGNRNLSYRI